MEETISLVELLQTLKKRLRLIVSITFIAVLISGIISYFFLTPIYQASTQLLVNQSKQDESVYNYNEVQTNLQLINTYNVIIKSPAILETVIDELNLDMTVKELTEKITVANEKDSQVVNVSVQDPDAAMATEIANKTASVFKTEIVKIMSVDNVKILTKAEVEDSAAPIKPRPLLNIAIALVVGLMVGVGLAFLLEYLDNTIKNEQDIEKLIGVPVLGVIATMDEATLKRNSKKLRSERSTKGMRGETFGS
ncbi:YveK family protein [Neobacillus sp. LXY-1]|uniref:YveK family protein n=1 Tax=Neobacillus sp. LXY-1 TaxID=3379133 RepID=UPI003EE03FE9